MLMLLNGTHWNKPTLSAIYKTLRNYIIMKKLLTTAFALLITAIAFAQVTKIPTAITPTKIVNCNCSDLKITAYLYKDGGTTNYIIRLDYFNNKTKACTPILKTLNLNRGGSDLITVPLAALELVNASNGRFIYRVKRNQLRDELLTTLQYSMSYTMDYGLLAVKNCPKGNQRVMLEAGEPIL